MAVGLNMNTVRFASLLSTYFRLQRKTLQVRRLRWRSWPGIFCACVLLALLSASARQGWGQQEESIQSLVRRAGVELRPGSIPTDWIGRKDKYQDLVELLQAKPESGDDWRNGLDALAVIAAGDPELARKALPLMKGFVADLNVFGLQQQRLPDLGASKEIKMYEYVAKAEVPYAIAILAERVILTEQFTNSNLEVWHDAVRFLEDGSKPESWNMKIEWSPQPYFRDEVARNTLMATRFARAQRAVWDSHTGHSPVIPWELP